MRKEMIMMSFKKNVCRISGQAQRLWSIMVAVRVPFQPPWLRTSQYNHIVPSIPSPTPQKAQWLRK